MNYLWYHLTRDPKFWVKVLLIPAVLVLALFDLLTHIFDPPGIFNLWFIKITLVILFLGIIVFGVYLYVTPRQNRKIAEEQAAFEKKRIEEVKKIIAENPQFQTFCYECRHFNLESKACLLNIINLKAKDIWLFGQYRYCLYWEASS